MRFLETFINTRNFEARFEVQNEHLSILVFRMSSHIKVSKLFCDLMLFCYERTSQSTFPAIG